MTTNSSEKPQEISDDVRQKYYYWRFRILYSTMIGYALFYIVRKNISMALPGMEHDLGITKDKLGLFLTVSYILYGVSKFMNGMWSDRANPRYFLTAGLLLSASMSILFGMSSTVLIFGIIWLMNGWFQGMGCGPCIKSLSTWYPSNERGFRFAIWNTSHSIGSTSVMLLNAGLVGLSFYTWRLSFFVPAGIAILGALFLFNRLRDTPESLGLPSVEEMYGHTELKHEGNAEGKISGDDFKKLLRKKVFGNPGVWFIGIASFFLYIVRFSLLDWGPTILSEMKGLSLRNAGFVVAGTEVFGLLGMLCSGWLMDKVFKSNGSLVCVVSTLALSVFAFLFWLLPTKCVWVYAVLLCGMGFMTYGPQAMLGPISANMATKNAAASAVGFVGFFSYLSGTISGWGLGLMVEHIGWHKSFVWIIVCALLAAALFAIPAIWNFSHKRDN
jgi:OPA family glycerol-3-phosphate transporter-like MFS transporter/OPA family sugar phosphate sensor protein UhpC-like MFS transporter